MVQSIGRSERSRRQNRSGLDRRAAARVVEEPPDEPEFPDAEASGGGGEADEEEETFDAGREEEAEEEAAVAPRRVSARANQSIKQAKAAKKRSTDDFELPSLTLLAEPKKNSRAVDFTPISASSSRSWWA